MIFADAVPQTDWGPIAVLGSLCTTLVAAVLFYLKHVVTVSEPSTRQAFQAITDRMQTAFQATIDKMQQDHQEAVRKMRDDYQQMLDKMLARESSVRAEFQAALQVVIEHCERESTECRNHFDRVLVEARGQFLDALTDSRRQFTETLAAYRKQ